MKELWTKLRFFVLQLRRITLLPNLISIKLEIFENMTNYVTPQMIILINLKFKQHRLR